ncbi:MFS general substrate transporter [Pseudovirgaria hyperparasitica]|uniref:MFS general substrate transporter n=1 Tax=Pseudovirgaria hyperparasitica TaxID=470096 RepID=A0A6A6WI65_9PEZI|nr:MFS general substrate transporter [Pseudovirgaria hyperparasitica]KAF2762503.1 MFS general substrate transporter [Pseudovirgaria hyperparasitica]
MAFNFLRKTKVTVRDSERTRAAELTLRQSIYPIALVTLLFFLWGFSYGLLDTLNKHFQNQLGITQARSSGLQAAYFGAYPLASLGHANWLLRRYGYKITFIWGLCLYGIGALVAWPCLLHRSFGGFCGAIFIIGNGLGSLETAANPYITVCGPPKYSEIRINISQAFNGIGTVVAPVMASYVFFTSVHDDEKSLQNVQWVYLAIACFVFLLAAVFLFSPIPEITDADMAFQVQETHAEADDQPFRKQYRLFHAAFAQFCYTGAQVAIASYFINYAVQTRPNTDSAVASKLLAGAQGAFALGRFVGVALMTAFKPRLIFLAYLTSCIIFLAPSITQRDNNTGVALLYLTLFFESICFPTIVALGMRGLGRHTKRGSGWIVAGVSGGAVVPPLLGVAGDRHGTALGMVVPLCFFVGAVSYAVCVNFVQGYRGVVDASARAEIGVRDVEGGGGIGGMKDLREERVEVTGEKVGERQHVEEKEG